eukprot:26869-Pelagococcus_subviridis.AAC.8
MTLRTAPPASKSRRWDSPYITSETHTRWPLTRRSPPHTTRTVAARTLRHAVASVPFRGRQVFADLVRVHVVHDDVVQPVHPARDAEQRREEEDVDAIEERGDEPVSSLQKPSMRAVVHREDEPLEIQRVERRDVRGAEEVRRRRDREERDERGDHRDDDVEEQKRDRRVALVREARHDEPRDARGRAEQELVPDGDGVVEVDRVADRAFPAAAEAADERRPGRRDAHPRARDCVDERCG